MSQLSQLVQQNCHISDAQYAGNYTLCIYLLKMREFYRWEQEISLVKKLSNDDVGHWLSQRETLWDEIDEQAFSPLQIQQQTFDPMDSEAINQQLESLQLVYSGGYGLYGKPVFFLGELLAKQQHEDYTLYISGKELARDLAAPPGMTQGKTIYIRRESLRRFIWEKVEESYWHKQENPLSRALNSYDFSNKAEESLETMTDHEVDTVLQHEIGEIQAGKILGDLWEEMLLELPRSQAEIMARAVRDNIADMLSTLPNIIEKENPAQMHFYFANLSSMRKAIFPALQSAYTDWLDKHNTQRLKTLVIQGQEHWVQIAQNMLKLYQQYGAAAAPRMETMINRNTL